LGGDSSPVCVSTISVPWQGRMLLKALRITFVHIISTVYLLLLHKHSPSKVHLSIKSRTLQVHFEWWFVDYDTSMTNIVTTKVLASFR
jgi:hypothetical protein